MIFSHMLSFVIQGVKLKYFKCHDRKKKKVFECLNKRKESVINITFP